MTGLVLCTVLLAPATPVPLGPVPAPANSKVDKNQANQFASLVDNFGQNVRTNYIKDTVTEKDLLEAAIRGLYSEVGLPVPDTVKADVRRADTQLQRVELLKEVRILLGNHPNLSGSRGLRRGQRLPTCDRPDLWPLQPAGQQLCVDRPGLRHRHRTRRRGRHPLVDLPG